MRSQLGDRKSASLHKNPTITPISDLVRLCPYPSFKCRRWLWSHESVAYFEFIENPCGAHPGCQWLLFWCCQSNHVEIIKSRRCWVGSSRIKYNSEITLKLTQLEYKSSMLSTFLISEFLYFWWKRTKLQGDTTVLSQLRKSLIKRMKFLRRISSLLLFFHYLSTFGEKKSPIK